MKRCVLSIWLGLFLMNASLVGADAIPQRVQVLGQEVKLKEKKGDAEKGFIAEYIPVDNNWDNWPIMFAVRFSPGENLDPLTSARAAATNVIRRKSTGDPMAGAQAFSNKDGSAGVDFLLSDKAPTGGVVYEHNVWVFRKSGKGILSYQIARRVYSIYNSEAEIKKFIADIPTLRNEMIKEIGETTVKPDFIQ